MLERKFFQLDVKAAENGHIEGYASRFGETDQGGDMVMPGAYTKSLSALSQGDRAVKMLWQHDPSQPIGVWDDVKEDETGLFVKGRLLDGVAKAQEVARMITAKAVDGLSVGYRTVRADRQGGVRMLKELELWEVSVVTFPMQLSARVDAKQAAHEFEAGNSALMKRLVEECLREADISISQAKAASSAAVGKLADMREAGSGLDELTQFMRQVKTGQ